MFSDESTREGTTGGGKIVGSLRKKHMQKLKGKAGE